MDFSCLLSLKRLLMSVQIIEKNDFFFSSDIPSFCSSACPMIVLLLPLLTAVSITIYKMNKLPKIHCDIP